MRMTSFAIKTFMGAASSPMVELSSCSNPRRGGLLGDNLEVIDGQR